MSYNTDTQLHIQQRLNEISIILADAKVILETRRRTLAMLLTELDGFEADDE